MSNFPASGAPSGAEGKVPGFVDAVQRAKEVITLFPLNSNTFPYLLLLNEVEFTISCLLCRLPQKLDQDQDLLQHFILHLLLDTNDLPTICLVVSTEQ